MPHMMTSLMKVRSVDLHRVIHTKVVVHFLKVLVVWFVVTVAGNKLVSEYDGEVQ